MNVGSRGSHWSPGGASGWSSRADAHRSAANARAGSDASTAYSRSPGDAWAWSAGADARGPAANARAGSDASPRAEGAAPCLPTVDQQQCTKHP